MFTDVTWAHGADDRPWKTVESCSLRPMGWICVASCTLSIALTTYAPCTRSISLPSWLPSGSVIRLQRGVVGLQWNQVWTWRRCRWMQMGWEEKETDPEPLCVTRVYQGRSWTIPTHCHFRITKQALRWRRLDPRLIAVSSNHWNAWSLLTSSSSLAWESDRDILNHPKSQPCRLQYKDFKGIAGSKKFEGIRVHSSHHIFPKDHTTGPRQAFRKMCDLWRTHHAARSARLDSKVGIAESQRTPSVADKRSSCYGVQPGS